MMVFRYDTIRNTVLARRLQLTTYKTFFTGWCSLSVLFIGCMRAPCTCATAPAAPAALPKAPVAAIPCVAVATAPAATQVSPPTAAPPAAEAAKAADVSQVRTEKAGSVAQRKIAWDGDENSGNAKGWADCDKKPDCKANLAPVPGRGRNKSKGLKFHGEGAGWIGGGWNLFGWWPENGGIDVTDYKFLRMAIRIEARSPEAAPNPKNLNVVLVCSSKKKNCNSAMVGLAKLTSENLFDANWHDVAVPMAQLTSKSDFDPKTVWEVDLNTWSETPKNFEIYIDDITFSVN